VSNRSPRELRPRIVAVTYQGPHGPTAHGRLATRTVCGAQTVGKSTLFMGTFSVIIRSSSTIQPRTVWAPLQRQGKMHELGRGRIDDAHAMHPIQGLWLRSQVHMDFSPHSPPLATHSFLPCQMLELRDQRVAVSPICCWDRPAAALPGLCCLTACCASSKASHAIRTSCNLPSSPLKSFAEQRKVSGGRTKGCRW